MRKLPQDFAFPLGLGSKNKQHNSTTGTTANNTSDKDKDNKAQHQNNNITNILPGSSNGDASPRRAPCQDLDTINL